MTSSHSYGFDDLGGQVALLLDDTRLAAFCEALRQVVTPDDVVADVGTGSGVLAAVAAHCGARRVFALERGVMADLAVRIMQANGLSDRVEILRGDARDIAFPEPPTVVVSETLGVFGADEDIAGLLGVVKQRCAPGARLIPQGFEVVLALLDDAALAGELDALGERSGVRLDPLRQILAERIAVAQIAPEAVVGAPCGAGWINLGDDALPNVFSAQLQLDAPRRINAIGAWFDSRLTDTITLGTGPGAPATSWANLKFPVDPPLEIPPGVTVTAVIKPRHILHRALWAWELRCGSQRRTADSFQALRRIFDDPLPGLGLRSRPIGERQPSARLEAWALILEGRAQGDVDAMAARLAAAMPQRYANQADARQEVIALLHAAGALA